MVVVDFDGTLLGSDGTLRDEDLDTLERLGREGCIRVIATGRSPFSYRRAIGDRVLPVDYFVFSSGAGVREEPSGRILRTVQLKPDEVARAAALFVREGLDFMIHEPIPDNHCFAYRQASAKNHDFTRRIGLYPDHSRPLTNAGENFGPAAQLLAVVPGHKSEQVAEQIRTALPELSVIRATSPIDHESTWVEVFARGVQKSTAAAWIAKRHGLTPASAMAVGNDYNDQDLLRWAGKAYVVANAPDDLTTEFPVVASNDEGGVTQAILRWRIQPV